MRINISLPDSLVKDMKKFCLEEGFTLSGFIRRAAIDSMEGVGVELKYQSKVPVPLNIATAPPLLQAMKKTEKKIKEFNKEDLNRPLICPKHGGQLLGGKYTCCE